MLHVIEYVTQSIWLKYFPLPAVNSHRKETTGNKKRAENNCKILKFPKCINKQHRHFEIYDLLVFIYFEPE